MNRISFFAAAAAFTAGVASSGVSGPLSAAPLPFLCLAVACACVPDRRAAIVLVCIALGAARGAADRAEPAPVPRAEGWYAGEVDSLVEDRGTSVRFSLATATLRFDVIAARDAGGEARRLPLPGDRVRVWGRPALGPAYRGPGISDGRGQLRAGGHDGRLLTSLERVHVAPGSSAPGVQRLAARAQRAVIAVVSDRGGDASGNAVVRALVAGDRSAIDPALRDSLRRAGIGHLLAVSGLHLAVVGVFLFLAVRRLWACFPSLSGRLEPAVAAAVVAMLASIAYALMTGARPSALRALLVASVVLASTACFRRPRALDALGFAALALLLWRPGLLHDASFQMSFAAAVCLSLAHRRSGGARTLVARAARAVVSLAAISLWAMMATAPTASRLFGEIAPAGVLVNIVALPLVELFILPVALAGVVISQVSAAAGGVALDLAIAAAGALVRLAAWVASVAPTLDVPPMTALETVGLALVLAALLARRGARSLVVAAVLAALVIASLYRGPVAPAGLRVTFLDVGQGDGAVVELPTGEVWLIDAGGRPRSRQPDAPGRVAVLGYLRARRIRHIDVAVISHAHPDHYLGLWAVGARMPIRRVWLAGADPDQPRPAELDAMLRWLRVLGSEVGRPPVMRQAGDTQLHAISPPGLVVDPVSSVNDNSLVMRIDHGGRRLLFAGDLEEEGEWLLTTSSPEALVADIVKVNHHGSRTSSGAAWVEATRASHAVISCGRRNRFGFPAREVVGRWRAAGARISRTDVDGAVTVTVAADGALTIRHAVE